MEKGNLDLAKYNLESLNQELQAKSFEVLYNLALIYEATNNLQKANERAKSRGLHPTEALLSMSLPRCPPAHPLLVACPEAPLLPFIPGLNWCDSGGGGSDGHCQS